MYISKLSNIFDFVSCCIWISIIFMKLWSRICFQFTENICWPYPNPIYHSIYAGLWAIIMVLMFMKVTIIFQFTALMGRFLKTVSLLIHDIFTFIITALVFFLGFLFCLYILANTSPEPTGTDFDSVSGTTTFLYSSFLTLQGPDDLTWNPEYPHAFIRFTITALVICYQVLAAILLLNLLIAMMSDTYTGVFQQAVAETNFYKIEQTISCVQPYGRLIGSFSFFILISCGLGNYYY